MLMISSYLPHDTVSPNRGIAEYASIYPYPISTKPATLTLADDLRPATSRPVSWKKQGLRWLTLTPEVSNPYT